MSRVLKHHDIKILPKFFEDVYSDRKAFEIRKDDRDYQIGDSVTFREWDLEHGYTGSEITVGIIYVLRNCPEYGLMDGYCIFGW
ncbi:MAG: DUF3850 domain-containing protein [Lachnospiraceae bacterium]|nr:DUF3850 domain-containing protein [Lachnospiraceae bacterium]